ncbi:polysaccharide deacetylase family protein [Chrysiogenes arsenatis]|uniref:polysaccharide deacetylase family protein n=1 Tax=Chrysiogenes arsenatis TaxID=309797 RepID=UPI00135F189A|nr:polysaccharide deacetylase family protein [Chrysiogenes arsenatis]
MAVSFFYSVLFCCALGVVQGGYATTQSDEYPSAVVFMYHRFGENIHPSTNVTHEQFAAHLAYLAQNDFSVWPLERLIAARTHGEAIPPRTVSITIDDAYASVYVVAFPLLQQYQFPATVFVPTDAIDSNLRGYMSWDQMREMTSHGIVFGNHTLSHTSFAERGAQESDSEYHARIHREVEGAQQRIDQELGTQPRLFAYPYGEYRSEAHAIVTEMGYFAFGQHSGAIPAGISPVPLPRFPMAQRYAQIDEFARKARTVALPIQKVVPLSPLLLSGSGATLTLQVNQASPFRWNQVACFTFDGTPLTMKRPEPGIFTMSTNAPLVSATQKRNRFNCTVPMADGSGRYGWYSHPWIRQN